MAVLIHDKAYRELRRKSDDKLKIIKKVIIGQAKKERVIWKDL